MENIGLMAELRKQLFNSKSMASTIKVSAQTTKSEINKMLSVKPIISLTEAEKKLLKQHLIEILSFERTLMAFKTNQFRQSLGNDLLINATRNAELYDNLELHERYRFWNSRSLTEHKNRKKFDIDKIIQKISKTTKKIRVLEIGGGTGRTLSDIKKKYSSINIETHLLQPFNNPIYPEIDFCYKAPQEFIPKKLEGQFDLVLSHNALMYSLFPHIGLESATKCLNTNGTLLLTWNTGYIDQYCSNKFNDTRIKFFKNYSKCKLTKSQKILFDNSKEIKITDKDTLLYQKYQRTKVPWIKWKKYYLEERGFFEILFLNKLNNLKEIGFNINYKEYLPGLFKKVPFVMTIGRHLDE